ncbi:hypothetical protein KAU09_02205 [Candidatus Parcubacteria bacterium]|nr:hypothetical protein [Candidatus Parcubacteria bacterium]
MQRYKRISIAFFIVLILAGIYFYFFYNKPNNEKLNNPERINKEQQILTGELSVVNSESITIKNIKDIILGSTEKNNFVLYKININKDTEVKRYLGDVKTREQFLKEQAEYEKIINGYKKNGKSTFGIEAPNWHVSENIKISDLRVGDALKAMVYKNKDEYIAQKIILEFKNKEIDSSLDKQINNKIQYDGVIKEINVKKNILKIDVYGELKEIILNKQTKFYLKTKKSNEQFQKEQEDFNKKIAGNKDLGSVVAPSWFFSDLVTIDNLRSGQQAIVYAEFINDILFAKKIEIIN